MTFAQYVAEYPKYHSHPANKALHLVGIPLIILSTIALFSSSWKLGLAGFVLGWTCQFVGHWIEGSRPAFFGNPLFLLAALVWYGQVVLGRLRSLRSLRGE